MVTGFHLEDHSEGSYAREAVSYPYQGVLFPCVSLFFASSLAVLLPEEPRAGNHRLAVGVSSRITLWRDLSTGVENLRFSVDEPASEAYGYRVGSRPSLELCQEVTDVTLDRLLAQEELLADLPVDKSVGDVLKNLELPGRGLLLELPDRRSRERDDLGRRVGPACCRGLETAGVSDVPA
jgi:hypothetical protein